MSHDEREYQRKHALKGNNQTERFEHKIELPEETNCRCCGSHHTHSEIVAVLDKRGILYFQCDCGSTIGIKVKVESWKVEKENPNNG